ncbi:TetR/AcrR family transcriptional regulator [Deinococcus sp. Arct2-2]|uniref:TetR/AcrR family transcriptional regulator n=1 Tax=Deinococcus sp. Arct2-2 TaxID=2568653 RepID=UPI0010A5415E|nr:TetR/AcrR family transcriptional regulator [Deinococcus sp. Arct2-2]THF71723.1 TetR/AcrR family transcriptional regulator [Deinococcus sp. Arct2-2]
MIDADLQAAAPVGGRKEQIYRVAARLFSEVGYRSTSMRDIAAALNMKAGSLYSHITSKEDLLWGIVQSVADEFDEALLPAQRSELPPADRLRLALEGYTDVVTRNLEFSAVLFSEWRQLPPERQEAVTARRDAVERVFRGILQDGVDSGDFAPDTNVKLTAVLALSGANWLPNWFRPGGRLSQTDVADSFVGLLLRGIERDY